MNVAQEVSILESILFKHFLFLTLQKCVINPAQNENFHEVYLKQMAKYTWTVRLFPAEETALSPLWLREQTLRDSLSQFSVIL